jgi:hypothetical protein
MLLMLLAVRRDDGEVAAPAPRDAPVTTQLEPVGDAAPTATQDAGVWPDAAGWQ